MPKARKTHDLTLKVGEYTNAQGEVRPRYRNVGALMQREDGSIFVALDSVIVSMEAQYVGNRDRHDRVFFAAWPERESEQRAAQTEARTQPAAPRAPAAETQKPQADFDDDIPF